MAESDVFVETLNSSYHYSLLLQLFSIVTIVFGSQTVGIFTATVLVERSGCSFMEMTGIKR